MDTVRIAKPRKIYVEIDDDGLTSATTVPNVPSLMQTLTTAGSAGIEIDSHDAYFCTNRKPSRIVRV